MSLPFRHQPVTGSPIESGGIGPHALTGWLRLSVAVAALHSMGAMAAPLAAMSPAEPQRGDASPCKDDGELRLHVPSPDWRDQVIYFLVTDRFDDGDASNNDQGASEFGAGDAHRYNGGDLKGVERRLGYIKGLGATAVWITPPVASQWRAPDGPFTGYHGYWAEHFKKVDAHVGTLADYRHLSSRLHCEGLYLVQDIVVNHTGNFFAIDRPWRAANPLAGYVAYANTPPVARPSQPPFDLNDPRRAEDRRAAIYHWTPDIANYKDPVQEHTGQMGGLDDLNTENPRVRAALRDSYGFWIGEAGVDAYRVDTAFYVPPEFFRDFLHSNDPAAPGIDHVARATGRERFLVFGEGFGIDRPGSTVQARKIERYMNDASGRPLMTGMLNFPLYGALQSVMARGRPTAELAERIETMMRLHKRPHLMPSFVDNHDVDRFLAGGSSTALKQALLAIMTLPGIPVIYYGTEQSFNVQRAAMFKDGFQSGGFDRFDTEAPLYQYVRRLTALRRDHRTLSRGSPVILKRDEAGAGALVYRQRDGKDTLLVAFNTAEQEKLAANIETGLPAGTRLEPLFAIAGNAPDLRILARGRLHLRLPARAGYVWRIAGDAPTAMRSASAPTIRRVTTVSADGKTRVEGTADANRPFKLVLDGGLAEAVEVTPGSDGRWQASLDTASFIDASLTHELVAWRDDGNDPSVSASRRFRVVPQWQLAVDHRDPAGDDHGPLGRYRYPEDSSWGANRQMDLRRVRAWRAAGSLKLELGMNRVTQTWHPANGFDHAAFTIYLELPGQPGGLRVMPKQNAELPGDMRWHVRLRANGWSNALFTAAGASASAEGTPAVPGAAIAVDAKENTVTFTLPAAALGHPASLKGARLYVTTWDYDGGYRALLPEVSRYAIAGGDGERDPLVMDDTPILVLK